MKAPIRFGTDGVRGPAGVWPIDSEGAHIIGLGIAQWCGRKPVFVGRDTRESSTDLAAAVLSGLAAGGCHALDLSVVPTAAVSCAVAASPAMAGVMITASHNPWADNGLKVVGPNGEKLTDVAALTGLFGNASEAPGGRIEVAPNPLAPWFKQLPSIDLSGRSILLDAAHGSAYQCAVDALEARGAKVHAIGNSPTGRNINANVGAMHPPDDLHGCDLGICLDGDADRLVLIDPVRGVLDGDDLLWMLARNDTSPVVGTVMTNGGLEAVLGDRLTRTGVGDAKVWAEMLRIGAPIGGEPSGHIMLQNGMPTSDGMFTAMRVLESASGGPLPCEGWERWPQEHRNVRNVRVDPELDAMTAAREAGHRVIVRASGTEPVVRVMVEGEAASVWADRIAEALPRVD